LAKKEKESVAITTPPFSFLTLISIEQKFFSRRNGHFGTHPNNKRGAACARGDGAQRFCAAFCFLFLYFWQASGAENCVSGHRLRRVDF
jgi:hypothetical protein